jgi:membrane associated rhomboid family serine protease
MPLTTRPARSPHAALPTVRERLAPARGSLEGIALLAVIVAFMWLLEAINSLDNGGLDNLGGLIPRDPGDLYRIFTSPFLHYSWTHLIDNTVPFAFMGVIIALRGAGRLALVTLIIVIVGGVGTWLIAPSGTQTVGASGIVFGYATYLFTRGVFDRSPLEILTGVIVGAVWGGALIASIVPRHGVSWQAHVCGAIGGVLAAWLLAARRSERTGRGPRSGAPGHPPSARPAGGRELHDALDRVISG